MKNSNDTIGNRTHDLPACNAVPRPIAPRLPPKFQLEVSENKVVIFSSSKLLDPLKTFHGPQVSNGWSIR